MNSENLTILYERLSHKNGCENESLSTENQKAYLEEYAARNSFTNFVHHTDDGWSGTRWDRLGFLQMMNDIERSGLGTDTHKRYEPFRARPFADRAIFRAVTRNGGGTADSRCRGYRNRKGRGHFNNLSGKSSSKSNITHSVKPSYVVLLSRAIINEVSSITTFSSVSKKVISNCFMLSPRYNHNLLFKS